MSTVFSLLISLYFNVHISYPYKSNGIAKLLCTFRKIVFSFRSVFRIPNICKNLFEVVSFSSSREILHPKHVKLLTCFNVILYDYITVLLMIGTSTLNVILKCFLRILVCEVLLHNLQVFHFDLILMNNNFIHIHLK